MHRLEAHRREVPADVHIPDFGIYLLESHHAATFQMEIGQWPFDKLCWIPVGRGKLALPDKSFPIGQDDLILLPANTWHRFVDSPSDPLSLVIACFDRAVIGSSDAQLQLLDQLTTVYRLGRPLQGVDRGTRRDIGDAFRLMIREQSAQKAGYEVVLQTELASLLVEIARGCSASPSDATDSERSIEEAVRYLDDYYYKPIRLNELAGRFGLSPRRFSELFKQRTGRTLIDYINAKRVASAEERLSVTGHIAYACLEAGFGDLGYFYRVFKKYTGRTPGEYLRTQPPPLTTSP